MTTSQETMTDTALRGQEAITNAMQIWLDNLHRWAPDPDTRLRGAVEVVDKMYDFADQMLVTHRELTMSWLNAYSSFITKAAYVAEDATKDVEYTARDMQDSVNSQRQTGRSSSTKDADAASKKS